MLRPAGGLSLNIEDMAKLAELYINRGRGLLSAETIERMAHSKNINIGEFTAGYGLFNYARHYDGIRYRGHDGGLPGWLSKLSFSPKHKAGFVVLQNSEQPQAFRAIVNLISEYLAKYFTQAKRNVADIPK
ncbi:MAG: CubicO group peptidase (beta-lactamase class C family) [Glaciecola sp.]